MGRKYSRSEIRQRLVDKHRHLMRINTNTQINEMSSEDILELVAKVAPSALPEFKSKDLQCMQTLLRVCQRNRALWVWSDHSVLLGYGLVLIVVGAVYDPLVYLTDDEVAKSHKSTMTVQEMVEQGEVYIMTHCSSSSADQAGLIPERVACLDSLADPIVIEDGLSIHDSLHFFKGDKQSAWFEAGIQRGGHYCCIACECHVKDFTDFTTMVQNCRLRGLREIQKTAICGSFGKIPNKVNSFESLSREELRQELVSRQIYDFPPNNKKAMTDILKDHLCGVQRVPALLLLNPRADLLDMNLVNYTVLSFEPLHDLKGHIANVLGQLPSVINQPAVKSKVKDYLDTFAQKPKLYGSDYREALIQVMHIIVNCKLNSDDPVHVLISTLVKISEIVYSNDSRRTPRQCLQFYNCAFLHHELYVDLFDPKRASVYFHSLLVHGPVQHELVCSRSVNAEAEERLFKQAGNAAKNTDHKIDGFVEALLVKLQCKQLHASPDTNCHKQISSENSRIKKAAQTLPYYTGSLFSKRFIQNHLPDFQSHLQRIAHYLIHGEGVWWYKTDSGSICFKDSDLDPEYHNEGPSVLHFRNSTLKSVIARASQCWQEIVHEKISIPIRVVRRYDTQGIILDATEIDLDRTQSSRALSLTGHDTQGLILDVSEIDPNNTKSTQMSTLLVETNETEAMDTTPVVGNDVEADCHMSDSISLCTGSVSMPLTTSTPQKRESVAECLPQDDDTTPGVVVDSSADATAVVNTQLIMETNENHSTSNKKTLNALPGPSEIALDNTKPTFQSKLATALLKTIGYCPELHELDKLRTVENTDLNECMILKKFFRRKLALLRTNVQTEMILLERNKQKKTDAYTKLSKELKNATVLITHLA